MSRSRKFRLSHFEFSTQFALSHHQRCYLVFELFFDLLLSLSLSQRQTFFFFQSHKSSSAKRRTFKTDWKRVKKERKTGNGQRRIKRILSLDIGEYSRKASPYNIHSKWPLSLKIVIITCRRLHTHIILCTCESCWTERAKISMEIWPFLCSSRRVQGRWLRGRKKIHG